MFKSLSKLLNGPKLIKNIFSKRSSLSCVFILTWVDEKKSSVWLNYFTVEVPAAQGTGNSNLTTAGMLHGIVSGTRQETHKPNWFGLLFFPFHMWTNHISILKIERGGSTNHPIQTLTKLTPLSMSRIYQLTPYTKTNSKWIKDLNVRPETVKLLEENIGKTLSDINHSRILYDPAPRVMEIKAKINVI